jgi:hypothetical protein
MGSVAFGLSQRDRRDFATIVRFVSESTERKAASEPVVIELLHRALADIAGEQPNGWMRQRFKGIEQFAHAGQHAAFLATEGVGQTS